jgi:hypothetical protein
MSSSQLHTSSSNDSIESEVVSEAKRIQWVSIAKWILIVLFGISLSVLAISTNYSSSVKNAGETNKYVIDLVFIDKSLIYQQSIVPLNLLLFEQPNPSELLRLLHSLLPPPQL